MEHIGLLILRVSFAGTMLVAHGLPKLMGFTEASSSFPDPLHIGSSLSLGLVIFAEFFCALAVVFGFKTRHAVIPLVINMSVAALLVHAQDPFAKRELAFLFLFAFIAIFLVGPGKYSLDKK